jgi:hypothetical protein
MLFGARFKLFIGCRFPPFQVFASLSAEVMTSRNWLLPTSICVRWCAASCARDSHPVWHVKTYTVCNGCVVQLQKHLVLMKLGGGAWG